eukprot:CAMPEP_0196795680 /NCGR_PEP_ID=MMETSP1104-20130614/36429_1 /TAXON_ID=33652 /ORGANISM="Cafeteria sp., Strain Caron Lab Isolate" /LENGTH=34 /DNA_ID= /DNA_START= /DNA_END= /DNA_ORIENTATION=
MPASRSSDRSNTGARDTLTSTSSWRPECATRGSR